MSSSLSSSHLPNASSVRLRFSLVRLHSSCFSSLGDRQRSGVDAPPVAGLSRRQSPQLQSLDSLIPPPEVYSMNSLRLYLSAYPWLKGVLVISESAVTGCEKS